MAAVTTVLAIAAGATALAGAGATAYSQKRARDQAHDAKRDAYQQTVMAERQRKESEDKASANAARDVQAVRRRIAAAFGRPRTGIPGNVGAGENTGLGGKSLIGS